MESLIDQSESNKDVSDVPKDPSKDNQNFQKTNKEIREEYFNQLRSWLAKVNNYQCFYTELQQKLLQNHYQQVLKNSTNVPKNVVSNAAPEVVSEVVPEAQATVPDQFEGIRCQIPSLWKRLGAEFIDFILLSIIKLMIAYFVVDSFLNIDFTKYNSIFLQDDFNVDYSTAVEMTSEIFLLEVVHRVLVCVYEVYLLQGGTLFQGGATIGKMLLDLVVVRADKLYHIRGQPTVAIALTPGSDLGWRRAAVRSISKNLFFAFLFPLPFLTAAANQNRCAYDVLCGSMVVEVIQPFRCEQSELIPIA